MNGNVGIGTHTVSHGKKPSSAVVVVIVDTTPVTRANMTTATIVTLRTRSRMDTSSVHWGEWARSRDFGPALL